MQYVSVLIILIAVGGSLYYQTYQFDKVMKRLDLLERGGLLVQMTPAKEDKTATEAFGMTMRQKRELLERKSAEKARKLGKTGASS